MAIEKMVLLKIIGTIDDMHPILKELILCENVHLNLNVENSRAYNNYLAVHQYESEIIGSPLYHVALAENNIINGCSDYLSSVEELSRGIGIELKIDKELLFEDNYSFEQAKNDLSMIQSAIGERVKEINEKKQQIKKLLDLKEKIDSIVDKDMDFGKIANLNYFDYELGLMSKENKTRLKRNYENLSAIVLKIGIVKSSSDNLYMIIYPKQFKDETENILKSLSWNRLAIPNEYLGKPVDNLQQIDLKIENLQSEINSLISSVEAEKETDKKKLNKIYNVLKLEDKIAEFEQRADFGNSAFALDVWVRESDKKEVEKAIAHITDKCKISEKTTGELGDDVIAPTNLKNNKFSKPFEMIVKMYGLPSYDEIDPTPFLAVTFCLAFGIMFGDIGQGFIYLLAGLLLRKRLGDAGGIAIRLGASSMIFGCVYGSFFGLEKEELAWLPSLIDGGPLTPTNIPMILVAGVVFGVLTLTLSYALGTANALRRGDIEEGIFGKNGIFGYLFFISFIMTIVALVGIINIPISLPLTILLISLVVLVLKQPIANIVTGNRPLFNESASSYLTESIFEAIETILGTLSNSISFVRVGAFALNHAGLFLAFMVISKMMPNVFLQMLILVIGNILILVLEGLVVLIQSLRLHYYEMFGKYFKGDGMAFKPIKLS